MVTGQLIGGLGNQLFISATILAYSLKHNMEYCLPRKVHHPHYPANKDHSYNFPNLKYCDGELKGIQCFYNEQFFHYQEIPKIDCDNIVLNGYFQSYKYFNDYKDEIIKLFGFDDIETKKDVCAIHVRRGDYLDFPLHHPTVTSAYLIDAIIYMTGQRYKKFKIFSDDIEYCKVFFGNKIIFEFSEGNDELTDLREMASCAVNITANSSFSWWGAYINPNPDKKIVMPSVWFGEALNHNTADLYLPNAIII